jgi:hypothetical protein
VEVEGGGSCSRPHVCHMQPTYGAPFVIFFYTGHKFCGFFDNFFWEGRGGG